MRRNLGEGRTQRAGIGQRSNCGLHCGITDRRDEAIAPAGQCLDKARIIGRVAERLPNLIDSRSEGVLEVDNRVFAPEMKLKIFSRDNLARVLQQDGEYLERLALDLDSLAGLPELTALQISLEESKGHSGRTLD